MSNPEQNYPEDGRLVPAIPFPPYAFVPGRSPHPISDPAGHSFGVHPPAPPPLDPETWQTNVAYFYGIDLFNAGFYWEAHEAWEGLWHAAGRRGVIADALKGLIKLAAAGVKHHEGKPQGVKSHASGALRLFQGVAQSLQRAEPLFLGFRLQSLIELAESTVRSGWPDAPRLRISLAAE